jgi:hypothetical protein
VRKAFEKNVAAEDQKAGGPGSPGRIETNNVPSDHELAKLQADTNLRAMNAALRKTKDGEERTIGRVQKIACRVGSVVYTIGANDDIFTLTSKDFISLTLDAYDGRAARIRVGCDSDLSPFDAVITYRPTKNLGSRVRGELVAIEFVPAGFRLMTKEEMLGDTVIIYPMTS